MTIQGLEVFLFQPDFASPPKLTGSQKVDEVALSEAPAIQAYVGDHPLHAFTHRFKFTDRATAASFEDFFRDRAGRWQPFWTPSWHAELSPVASIADGTSLLSISPVGYATVYDPTHANLARLGHYVFLIHYDGTVLVRRVTAVSGTSPEVLTLDSPVTREFALGQFFVGFLYCVTTLNDTLALTFNGLDNAEASVSFVEESSFDATPDPTPGDPETPDPVLTLIADYSTDVSQGDPPLTVAFTDTSLGDPTTWRWQWRDGTADSTTQNPTHEFVDAGRYAVKLTVTDANGNSSGITREIIVNAEAEPPEVVLTASFTATPDTGDAALDVFFVDTSEGTPTVWLWNFGDGNHSADQNPLHNYPFPGVYTVTLQIRDTNGATSTAVDTIVVTVASAVLATCDSGETYYGWYVGGPYSCATCCTALDAMAVDDIEIWDQTALVNCLGLTVSSGMVFEFNSKFFGIAYSETQNTNGSLNLAGAVFYDVVRIS